MKEENVGVNHTGQTANDAPQYFSNTVSIGALETVFNGVTAGVATLAGTTGVIVNTAAVQSNSMIFIGYQGPGATTGAAYVSALTAGTSFTIKSVASDTSKVAWMIVNPA